jgi:signal transduction histidine kinase
MRRSRERLAPLAALVGASVFSACLCTLIVAAVVLHTRGGMDDPLWQVVVAGTPMAAVLGAAAAWLATRFARTLRLLRADALRRLHDPSAPVGSSDATSVPAWTGSEMVELARTLEALLAGLVEAEEGARGQLSAELHDTVAQSLSAARSMLADRINVDEAAELIAEAEDQVRAVMARTRPPALREGDLARAVGGLRDDMANRYGLEVDVAWPTEAYPVPLVTAVTVYRFFQEGLLNVIKHADVDLARAELRIDEEWVVAVVADEGPGFDPDDVRPDQGRHVGLGLLRERARLVGGSLEVASWPATGTALTLRLPRGAGGAAGLLPLQRASVSTTS